jgi:hypothetical protein
MMWNGVKVGKVGTINVKSLKMLSLSCELILYYARKKLCPGTTKTTMYRVLHLDVACAVYSVCVLWCIAALLCY